MKMTRTVYTQILALNARPHQINRSSEAERYASAYIGGGLFRTTKPLPNGFEELQNRDYRAEDVVQISIRVCFDKKPPNAFLTEQEAMKKFTEIAGLKRRRHSSITPIAPDRVKDKVCFVNVFSINGEFEIVDEEKFAKAFEQGVGRRFSYGYGLMEVAN
jgi:hypothetical protein